MAWDGGEVANQALKVQAGAGLPTFGAATLKSQAILIESNRRVTARGYAS